MEQVYSQSTSARGVGWLVCMRKKVGQIFLGVQILLSCLKGMERMKPCGWGWGGSFTNCGLIFKDGYPKKLLLILLGRCSSILFVPNPPFPIFFFKAEGEFPLVTYKGFG